MRHAHDLICILAILNAAHGRTTMKKWIALCIAVGCAVAASVLQAQTWPQRPVKVIVPFTAGGHTDTQARIISERLSVAFGQQFLVENRVGASGAIAAEFVAKSTADGYTLFFAATTQFSILPLVQKVNYDPLKDFAPISILGTNPLVLGVHLSVALFASRAGLKMTHIPYKGAQAVTDVVGGQVQMSFGNTSDMIQHSKSGKIRMLAVTGEKRMPQLPDLPALAEFYPGFRTIVWNGLLAPAATPRQIIDRVAQEVAKAAREPGIIERLNKIGIDALGNTP